LASIHGSQATSTVFLTLDLEAGNMLVKQLILLGNASAAGIVLGARAN
jgi:hypothetical protein